MSNEIFYSSNLRVSKGLLALRFGNGGSSLADMAGDSYSSGVLSLTTTWESVPKGDIVTIGFSYFENQGTDDIEIREDLTGSGFFLLKPGERFALRLGSAMQNPAVRAVATTSKVLFALIED